MNSKITLSDKILAATFLKLIPKRVTPNQVTMFRFFCVPFVVFLLYTENYALGLLLFAIAAFTDALDGAMARTRDQITQWGETYDPLADKLLILSTALIIIPKYLGVDILFAIIFVEMVLIGAAYYRRNMTHRRISANGWGKAKMICQSIGVSLVLLFIVTDLSMILSWAQYTLYAAILLAIASLVTYGI